MPWNVIKVIGFVIWFIISLPFYLIRYMWRCITGEEKRERELKIKREEQEREERKRQEDRKKRYIKELQAKAFDEIKRVRFYLFEMNGGSYSCEREYYDQVQNIENEDELKNYIASVEDVTAKARKKEQQYEPFVKKIDAFFDRNFCDDSILLVFNEFEETAGSDDSILNFYLAYFYANRIEDSGNEFDRFFCAMSFYEKVSETSRFFEFYSYFKKVLSAEGVIKIRHIDILHIIYAMFRSCGFVDLDIGFCHDSLRDGKNIHLGDCHRKFGQSFDVVNGECNVKNMICTDVEYNKARKLYPNGIDVFARGNDIVGTGSATAVNAPNRKGHKTRWDLLENE